MTKRHATVGASGPRSNETHGATLSTRHTARRPGVPQLHDSQRGATAGPLAAIILCSCLGFGPLPAAAEATATYKALHYAPPATAGTWRILDHDGANRKVEPYLSSLGLGESATGVIASPAWTIKTEKVTFTLCGHGGPRGTGKKNFVALVDSASGTTLRKTFAPGSDAMQRRSWDVTDLAGRQVRMELHDGDSQAAFAWLGVGMVDAGAALQCDFRNGLPPDWNARRQRESVRRKPVLGGVPFDALASHATMVPATGSATIPCDATVERLFFLGGTVANGQPLAIYAHIEIEYRDGAVETFPLRFGYTLDGQAKLLSRSRAIYLHPSGDPFQYYQVIRPRRTVIKAVRLRRNPKYQAIPRITAITCETAAAGANLHDLPARQPSDAEAQWIEAHTISATAPPMDQVVAEIRRQYHLQPNAAPAVLKFQHRRIGDATFEAASVCDVNGDGRPDIVSGDTWYAGPDFRERHTIAAVKRAGEYWSDFADYPLDVNGDGRPDIVTGAFFGAPLRWLENPLPGAGPWKVHPIAQVGPIETLRCWDVDGDGSVEIVPNAGGNVVFFRLVRDAQGKGTGRFTRHEVKLGGCGHGLGFGDINGDGRGDFVVPDGWLEAPADPLTGTWQWHTEGFHFGAASVPILVHDVNHDGRADLIVGQAHDYGLDWYEQQQDRNGKRTWWKHAIDRGSSQYHDLALADIDNDGALELVTGKRYRAHNGHDPGSTDPLVVRYFDFGHGEEITCHSIDTGPTAKASGVGIYFWIADVDGNGWQDIVAPGKEGLDLFLNRGKE